MESWSKKLSINRKQSGNLLFKERSDYKNGNALVVRPFCYTHFMKKLIWLIGKPGSGKTTIGQLFAGGRSDTAHFSYGQLLKQVQPNPASGGYSLSDREKVNHILINESKESDVVFVDGNPYSQLGFGFISQVESYFDEVYTIELTLSDKIALSRLEERGREIVAHDGKSVKDRVVHFNEQLKPLIDQNKTKYNIHSIDIETLSREEVLAEVSSFLSLLP